MEGVQRVRRDPLELMAEVPPALRSPRLQAVYRLAWAAMGSRPAGRREPGYRFYHGHRVARIALRLWEVEGLRASRPAALHGPEGGEGGPVGVGELIWVGALLHDVGKEDAGPDHGGDHAERGRAFVHEHLSALYGGPALALIGDIVLRHNKRGDPAEAPEVAVVQDADLIDHFGVMEVWLGAYWMAAGGGTLYDYLEYCEGERARSWWEYAVRHVRFETARRELALRMARARAAIADLRREAAAGLYIEDGG